MIILARLSLFSFLSITCYHIKSCVYSNPKVVSFRFYLFVGIAISLIGSLLKYFIDFAVTKTTANIFNSSMILNGTLYSKDQLNEIYKNHNSKIAEYFLMLSK